MQEGKPIRILALFEGGGTNEQLVLNLPDISAGANTPLNEGTFGQALPLPLNNRWAVWRERQWDGRDVFYAYDIQARAKHSFPAVMMRRMVCPDRWSTGPLLPCG